MKQLILSLFILMVFQVNAQDFSKLAVGEKAPDFSLKSLSGDKVKLSEINKNQTVVLIVLRGWVGSQCPVCSRQVGGFISEAEKLREKNISVLFVYPGPSAVLNEKANEFTEPHQLPDNFYFTLDPDYSMINKYNLRWDAPKETAYPSTFILDKSGKIAFSKISKSHGGRAKANEVLDALEKM